MTLSLQGRGQRKGPNCSLSVCRIFKFAVIAGIVFISYLTWDYYGPAEIQLEAETVWGLSSLRADDLVVQGRDEKGHLWATRGLWAYRLKKGDDRFTRQYHVPTGFSIYWLRNFTVARTLSGRTECVELLPLSNGGASVMSAGYMWFRSSGDDEFKKTLPLRHYGFGVGRGVTPAGLTRLSNGDVLWGEYFWNPERTNVGLFRSQDGGENWEMFYEFSPGQARHVHIVKQDPYTGDVFWGVGDKDNESRIMQRSFQDKVPGVFGEGSQLWRTLTLIFLEDSIVWGTDTETQNPLKYPEYTSGVEITRK
jgi:hypothetical protein